jgi:adiponectin receptor
MVETRSKKQPAAANGATSAPSAKPLSQLLHWTELEAWQRDNHYIHTGYRPASNSYLRSIQSLFYIHNETVNVYSHLLGSIFAVGAGAYAYSHRFWLDAAKVRYASATTEDLCVLACFFAGAAGCLGMSATFHMLSNHSETVAAFGNRLDYLGIVLLIWGSFVPTLYYGFPPEDVELVRWYWGMVGFSDFAAGLSGACD